MRTIIKITYVILMLPFMAIGIMGSFAYTSIIVGRDFLQEFTDWVDK